MFVNSFHDLDEGYELQTVIRRNEGDEIVFDFWHSGDEQTYTGNFQTHGNGACPTPLQRNRSPRRAAVRLESQGIKTYSSIRDVRSQPYVKKPMQ